DGIIQWFTSNLNNGLLEGINSVFQAAKRKARESALLDMRGEKNKSVLFYIETGLEYLGVSNKQN
ncbi:hypothetical protein J2S13_003379, partial [Oikeobacillus pervagus]|nr:hypothetical protein [Oikeobacillus pervagus]